MADNNTTAPAMTIDDSMARVALDLALAITSAARMCAEQRAGQSWLALQRRCLEGTQGLS